MMYFTSLNHQVIYLCDFGKGLGSYFPYDIVSIAWNSINISIGCILWLIYKMSHVSLDI